VLPITVKIVPFIEPNNIPPKTENNPIGNRSIGLNTHNKKNIKGANFP
jgi:hypothetical protein